ncbi:unnamed protein product, partial [Mesorhabditis spiculigera]
MDYTKFDDDLMSNGYGNEDCLDMAELDRWNDFRCDVPENIVCQKKAIRFDDLTDYNRAEVVCKELGAELPNIHSEAENAAIHALDVPNQRLRLGATRFGSGKYDFKWSNGSPMDFTKFDDASMGNSYGYENCLDMAEVDRWNDVRCDMPEIIVCQKKGSHISTGK